MNNYHEKCVLVLQELKMALEAIDSKQVEQLKGTFSGNIRCDSVRIGT